MKPDEAIEKLRSMQFQNMHGTNVLGEIADMITEAKKLIEHFGWTSSEDTAVLREAQRWLKGKSK